MEQARESFRQNPFQPRFIVSIALSLVAFILLMGSWFTIEQYESGVVTTWGKISYVASPGLGVKVPLVQSVSHIRTDIQSLQPKEKVNTYTSDNQEIDILFTVFYRLPPDKVAFVYTNAQDYYARLFNIANDRVKAEMGKVKLEHFAEHRGEIRDRIRTILVADAQVLGLEVTDFQFADVDYTKLFRDAVNAASVQKANVETREWERVQAEKAALTARIKAEGEANAVKAKADGEAYANLTVAKAQAEALRVQNAALVQSKDVLELRRIEVTKIKAEKWNGALPTAIYAGAPIPFLNIGKGE